MIDTWYRYRRQTDRFWKLILQQKGMLGKWQGLVQKRWKGQRGSSAGIEEHGRCLECEQECCGAGKLPTGQIQLSGFF